MAILAKLFLGENSGTFQFVNMAITMVGVILVIRPPFLMGILYEKKDESKATADNGMMHFYLGVLTMCGVLVQALSIVATKALKVELFFT